MVFAKLFNMDQKIKYLAELVQLGLRPERIEKIKQQVLGKVFMAHLFSAEGGTLYGSFMDCYRNLVIIFSQCSINPEVMEYYKEGLPKAYSIRTLLVNESSPSNATYNEAVYNINKMFDIYNEVHEKFKGKMEIMTNEITDLYIKSMEEQTKNALIHLYYLDQFEGLYLLNDFPSYHLRISTIPMEIWARDSGYAWESFSCESIWQECFQGVFSDIEQNNAIVTLEDEFGINHARLILRWGYTESQEIGIGFPVYWYSEIGKIKINEEKSLIENEKINAKDLTATVQDILKRKNAIVDFKSCITPYVYRGFTDRMNDKNMKINFGSQNTIIGKVNYKKILSFQVTE